jgi:hypothetical protein
MKSGSRLRALCGTQQRNAARLATVCVTGVLLATSACATVAPYERERLARPDMELGRNGDARAGE